MSTSTLRRTLERIARRLAAKFATGSHLQTPVVIEDSYGIRSVRYPFEHQSVQELAAHKPDRPQFEMMKRLIHAGDVVFDVGAYIGLFAVHASRLAGEDGRVYAFEPVPETFGRLRETLAMNRCDNVRPQQKAICNRVGRQPMNLFAATYSAWNSLGSPVMKTPSGRRAVPSESVEVETDTLDHFTQSLNISRIQFLKVDVEGFEKHVFLGAKRLLQEHRVDWICFEISQAPLKGAGVTAREVFEILEAHGYRVWSIDTITHDLQGPVHDSSEDWTNYVASWKDPATGSR